MNIFSQPDYYPSPSSNVITYSNQSRSSTQIDEKNASTRRKRLLNTDIHALIVYLSSPIDPVDYSAFSDFFLIYRNFITPLKLHELLISRFKWSYIETISQDNTQTKIGEISLVRTFVLIRHSLLNNFLQDFIGNKPLRLLILQFLNDDFTALPKIVQQCIINLKKIWIMKSKQTWENIIFDGPVNGDWLLFQLKDVSQLAKDQKRTSRLSFMAIKGSSSPEFRNESMLSLYKMDLINTDYKDHNTYNNNEINDTDSKRTGSMLLFPNNNSNIQTINIIPMIKKETDLKKEKHMTLVQRMSKVIKDVDYPKSPEINRIIPPTPAKKVEFILNSLYVPESQNMKINKPKQSIQRSSSLSRNLSHTSAIFYKGALSLLAKWKHNHSNQDSEMFEKPEMDTFVKYVISITSLDHENSSDDGINNTNGIAKFDILSARTIDEVEYLISLENKMIQEVKELHSKDNDYSITNHRTNQIIVKQNTEFSALDNLDLYQTVNTIAKSVISLSNTLQKSNDNALIKGTSNNKNTETFPYLSPSFDRRKIKSTTATIFNSSTSALINSNIDQDGVNGPQRLIFHDTEATDTHISSSEQQPSGSPLKHLLPTGTESSDPVDYYRSESRISSVTYDSELSATSPGLSNALSEKSDESTPGLVRELGAQTSKGLSKKDSLDNLREFTFEDEDEKINSEINEEQNLESYEQIIPENNEQHDDGSDIEGDDNDDDDMISVSLSQDEDTNSMLEDADEIKPLRSVEVGNNTSDLLSPLPSTKKIAMRPASGRISIMKRRTVHTPLSDRISNTKSPMRKSLLLLKDNDFLQKDNALFENELKLAKLEEVTNRDSYTPSVSTSRLFNSTHNSPKKITIDDGGRIRLSIAPSMNSIQSGSSFSSSMSLSTQSPLRHKVLNNLRDEFQKDKVSQSSSDVSNNGNKYLFSPDNDSLNAASPEKDMEELKNKFLQSSSNSPSRTEINSTKEGTTDADILVIQENMKKDLNPTNLKDIADMPDDSMHDDPVNVAMLKLEGKYSKEETQLKMQSSPNVSTVSKDVGLLNLEQIVSIPRTPGEKRRSLLIERRRKTIMTIPYTPETQGIQNTNTQEALGETEMAKLQNLMKSYSIEDPNLEITNSQHHIPFILMYDSKSVAEQLTLIEKELLKEIDWKDLLDLNIEYDGPMVTSWLQLLIENESLSGIDLMVARFNLTVTWIVSEISLTQDIKMRRNTIQRFIHVAEHCREFQNYNTLMAIVLALSSITVQKMIDAWRLIEPGDLLTWEELKKICNLDRNYSSIRLLLSEIDPLTGCIPFVAIYLSDLAINSEKKNWIKENKIINYNKFDMNVQIVKHFIQLSQWSKFYKFKPDHELLSKCVYISTLTDDEIELLNNGLNL
ncbi:similar to Saccharomyces cerevisiae YAL024C LTE1 Protein similar to GDP/GTP exchange factors but without detectable GEF activity [Maudiozyma saulgeensis]|uniref:Guanine nucleotide exchange factor LTE1 n=1 Tax=Maudiozyma saulgeensis TaxID=1789683 RepID=A0A1X7R726_9SACH|nr:similar to Saccharomyces cerevisiae YAL024C LTE1 Protein similar to GDP/GTP exchange factors but without detectable GEF activity [Kazachstania saulgeensis]